MDIRVLCGFRFFKLDENSEYEINPIILTSNFEIINKEFSSVGFESLVGKCRIKTFEIEPSFGYNILKHPDPINYDFQHFMQDAARMSGKINSFFSFLWFVKDCRSHISEIIFFSQEKGWITINPNYETYSSSNGESEYSTFNLEELKYAESIWKKLSVITSTRKTKKPYPYPIKRGVIQDIGNLRPYNESSRIERAMNFLFFARRASFMPMKIAMYIPIFESLFSSETTEISHKVAERCSFYLGGSREDKIKNYDIIKKAYDIRSKLLHGANLTEKPSHNNHNKIETQIEISTEIDCLTREVLTKVIMEDSEIFLANDMSSFYKQLIFS